MENEVRVDHAPSFLFFAKPVMQNLNIKPGVKFQSYIWII